MSLINLNRNMQCYSVIGLSHMQLHVGLTCLYAATSCCSCCQVGSHPLPLRDTAVDCCTGFDLCC
jgi:hypothetical protein